jgi:hypothetical protein
LSGLGLGGRFALTDECKVGEVDIINAWVLAVELSCRSNRNLRHRSRFSKFPRLGEHVDQGGETQTQRGMSTFEYDNCDMGVISTTHTKDIYLIQRAPETAVSLAHID